MTFSAVTRCLRHTSFRNSLLHLGHRPVDNKATATPNHNTATGRITTPQCRLLAGETSPAGSPHPCELPFHSPAPRASFGGGLSLRRCPSVVRVPCYLLRRRCAVAPPLRCRSLRRSFVRSFVGGLEFGPRTLPPSPSLARSADPFYLCIPICGYVPTVCLLWTNGNSGWSISLIRNTRNRKFLRWVW